MTYQNKNEIDEIRKINRDLEQFTSLISHDLQQPLITIANYLKRVQKKYGHRLDHEPSQMINVAVEEADRLILMTKELLQYSKLGKKGIKLKSHMSEKIIKNALLPLTHEIQGKEAQITHANLPVIRCNKSMLTQLFQNLISNALKYSGNRKPRIHIQAKQEKEHWLFSVADNGIGIKENQIEYIFEIFHRSEEGKGQRGSGVGLALCKKVVDLHGGTIWVESSYKNGSTFYFTIPE